MQTFSYIITDLTDRESKPIKVQLATHDEAVMYGTLLAREMLADMPDLTTKGMCVTIRDGQGETISILPFELCKLTSKPGPRGSRDGISDENLALRRVQNTGRSHHETHAVVPRRCMPLDRTDAGAVLAGMKQWWCSTHNGASSMKAAD